MRADAYFTNQNNLESEFVISRLGVRVPPSAYTPGNSRYAVPRLFFSEQITGFSVPRAVFRLQCSARRSRGAVSGGRRRD